MSLPKDMPEELKNLFGALMAFSREPTEEELVEHRKTCMGCAAAYADEQRVKAEGTAFGEATSTAAATPKRAPIGYMAFIKGPTGEAKPIPRSFSVNREEADAARTTFTGTSMFSLFVSLAGKVSVEIKPVYVD